MRPCIASLHFKTGTHPGHVEVMRHNTWELIFILSGEVQAEIAGKAYRAKAPCFLFISNYEPHVLTVTSANYERYVLLIDPNSAKGALHPPFLQTVFSVHPPLFSHLLPVSPETAAEFRIFLEALAAEQQKAEEEGEGEGERIFLSAFLWKLFRFAPHLFSPADGSAEKIVAAVRAELEAHPEKKLDLGSLAEEHYISPYYLSRVFHRVTGYSIKRYLLLCRISLACTLLSQGEKCIAKVATACGLPDASNFSRYFREITGISPWEYRKTAQSGRNAD